MIVCRGTEHIENLPSHVIKLAGEEEKKDKSHTKKESDKLLKNKITYTCRKDFSIQLLIPKFLLAPVWIFKSKG